MLENEMLRHLKKLRALIRFKIPTALDSMKAATFSDASINVNTQTSYGQTGYLTGVLFENNIFHRIDRSSNKQRRVCLSSYGAEIRACPEADDTGFALKYALKALYPRISVIHQLWVDSRGLFDTVTTLHEGHEYRLGQTA